MANVVVVRRIAGSVPCGGKPPAPAGKPEPRSREPGSGPAARFTHGRLRHRRAVSPAIAPPLFRAAAAGAGGRSLPAARDVRPPHRPVCGGQPNPRGARRAPSERMGFAKKFPPGHRDAAPAARAPPGSLRLRAGARLACRCASGTAAAPVPAVCPVGAAVLQPCRRRRLRSSIVRRTGSRPGVSRSGRPGGPPGRGAVRVRPGRGVFDPALQEAEPPLATGLSAPARSKRPFRTTGVGSGIRAVPRRLARPGVRGHRRRPRNPAPARVSAVFRGRRRSTSRAAPGPTAATGRA